ncbi:membrane protein [Fibrobacterales bacterium]|nr:membrane protein [Fibrobacterales bacterium]
MQKILILAAFAVFFFSCNEKQQPVIKVGSSVAEELAGQKINLEEYISAKPAKVLSSKSAIDLEFSQNMIPNHLVGYTLEKSPFEFEPEIKGQAKWLTSSLLQFVPENSLPSGKQIKGVFNGKSAFGENTDVNNFEFEFEVIPNEILEVKGNFEPMRGNVNTALLELELTFAELPNLEKLKKELNLSIGKSELSFELSKGGNNKVNLVSAEIPRTDREQVATFALPKNWTMEKDSFQKKFLLAAKGDFKVVSDNEGTSDGELKSYEWTFSDPISTEDVSGFLSVEPSVKYKVSSRGRVLKVRGNFQSGAKYTVRIKQGMPSGYGTKLANDFLREVFFKNENPQVKWIGNGLFLPLENKGKLQFQTMNAANVKLEVREIPPQNLSFFLQNNRLRSGERWFSDVERTTKTVYSGTLKLGDAQLDKWLKSELDLSAKIKSRAGAAYFVKLSFDNKDLIGNCKMNASDANAGDLVFETESSWDNPCQSYYYYDNGTSEKFFIASSIALTAKKSDEEILVWATDVATAEPVSGLTLELSDYINEVVATQKTNSNGFVSFKNYTTSNKEPAFLIRGSNDRGFALLKLEDENWETSRFDVGGVAESGKMTKFFGYTERGVYRPGDTIHFSGVLREGIFKPLGDVSVSVSVSNPQGSVVSELIGTTTDEGLVSFEIPTKLESPTGYWNAEVKSGGNTWKYDLRVETVKPNRLKNFFELPEKLNGLNPRLTGKFQSKYLFGAPADNLPVNIDISVKPKKLNFSRYPNFIFNNPVLYFEGTEKTLFKGNLNSEGRATIDAKLNLSGNKIAEAATIKVNARVEEKGGGYTESSHSVSLSPYPVFVGLREKSSWTSVKIGDTLKVPFVVLDELGKQVFGRDLNVKIYQNRRFSWWEGGRNDKWDFRTQSATFTIYEGSLTSGTGIKEFSFVPQEEGLLLVEISDVAGGHSAGQYVYASSWGYGGTDFSRIPEASHINLTSDKKVYYGGDSLRISFESPSTARALLSVERGGEVLNSKWINAKAGLNVASFAITEDMIPNVYAVLSLIQPMKSVEGEKPLRLYGILPVAVEKFGSSLDLTMEVPKEIKPEENFTISVKNNSKENASFTLAVVDEGLLDLTNFKTPNPKKFFFAKGSLKLKTLDNLDEIIGALLPDMDSYFSIGGDEENASGAINPKERRFNAVSLFSGVKAVKAGKTQTISFKMPNYIGSVRVELVGVSKNAFAGKDTSIAVKKPLMILPTAPRVAKPSDKFEIPVSVFAMDDKVKSVKVSLAVSNELKVIGSDNFNLKFNNQGEQDGKFLLEVQPTIGTAKIVVTAEGNGFKSADTISLPILSQSSLFTNTTETTLNAGDEWKSEIENFGISGTNSAELVLRTMPSFNIGNRLNYLINYPYGCLEQTVSAVFPQLYIEQLTNLSGNKKQEVSENINAGIDRLREFSMPKGFSYWAGESQSANPWATSYAGHFLLEAKKLGYSVPQKLLDTWKNWELESAKKGLNARTDFRYQAYRLYLLALADDPQIGAMNLLKENYLGQLDFLSKHLLAGAYHLAGQKKIAEQVLESNGGTLENYRELSGTYGSDLRDQALAAIVLVKMNKLNDAQRIYADFVKKWNEQSWWSTQESAFALLAYSTLSQNYQGGDIEAIVNDKKVVVSSKKPFAIDVSKSDKISVRALNGTIFAELQTKGIPLKDTVSTSSKGLAMSRYLYDLSGNAISINQVRQGEPFYVVVKVKNNSGIRLQGLALSSLFPSGFEIVNERLDEDNSPTWLSKLNLTSTDYTDIRDDRVNWFFSLSAGKNADFAVKIHPSYNGSFRWPALTLEAMYAPNYFARIAGMEVEVR